MPAPTTVDRWIVHPKRCPQARLRLFCFPYAGGGASAFYKWPDDLPPDVEVIAIQPPGREGRLAEAPYLRLDALVDDAVRVLQPYLDKPFVFFGHSMGALIAFETARTFRRIGAPGPLHFVASARRAPQVPLDEPLVCDLPEPEFLAEVRRMDGTPEEVFQTPELLELLLPLLRADFTVNDTYRYREGERLPCPITTFGGTDDDVDAAMLRQWSAQTTRAFALHMIPGGHFFLNSARRETLRLVAEIVSGALAGARTLAR
jgi:medium-chain acyl-[acyl-carrier-protein] hydrolase